MHYQTVATILSANNGMNIYRGCTHGCIYCDARSACYHMEHAFEDVEIKANAPQLLEAALRRKRRRCMIGTGAMCDPYLPLEQEIGYTRKCLEIIARYGFGLAIQTKSPAILRDLDLLKRINAQAKCVVQITITTFDDALCRIVEPHVACTSQRLDALSVLHENGIPTVVWLCPILPFINDTEENVLSIVRACRKASVYGILTFGMGLTLREGDREYYYRQLDLHFPGLRQKYEATYGLAYELPSPNSRALMQSFVTECKNSGIVYHSEEIFRYLRKFPTELDTQLSLFDK